MMRKSSYELPQPRLRGFAMTIKQGTFPGRFYGWEGELSALAD